MTEYNSVEVRRQWQRIDVMVVVNGDTVVVIEDKTSTRDHSDQLRRYRAAVAAEFPADRIAAVYLKTGDQGSYRTVEAAGYGLFLRRHLLDVLGGGEGAKVQNAIFADFHFHLRRIEAAVQAFRTAAVADWNQDWSRWRGFYNTLQAELRDGDWGPVNHRGGEFTGFWWHWREDKYLQLEHERLCFKITVPEKAEREGRWEAWHHAIMAAASDIGVRLVRPTRRPGTVMTVAVLDGDYRQTDPAGRLDLSRTVCVLRQAEAVMDAALARMPAVPSTPALG